MILAVLAFAGLAWWLHREGLLLPNLRRLGVAASAGLVALRLLETGQVAAACLVAAGGVWWWTASRPPAARPSELAAARAVLGVPPSADRDAINAAWRRIIADVHPDRGGSADLAARVSAARDLLLRR